MALTLKLTTDDKTEIAFPSHAHGEYTSLSFTNMHTSSVDVSLWVTAQVNPNTTDTNITDTGTDVNFGSGYAATTSSQAIVVDGTTATGDIFLNENVYKSDGKLFGTCTTVHASGTPLTFSGGLKHAMVNNDSLYVGTTHYILKSLTIPTTISLKLDHDEFNFNPASHKLYVKSSNASGLIDIIIR